MWNWSTYRYWCLCQTSAILSRKTLVTFSISALNFVLKALILILKLSKIWETTIEYVRFLWNCLTFHYNCASTSVTKIDFEFCLQRWVAEQFNFEWHCRVRGKNTLNLETSIQILTAMQLCFVGMWQISLKFFYSLVKDLKNCENNFAWQQGLKCAERRISQFLKHSIAILRKTNTKESCRCDTNFLDMWHAVSHWKSNKIFSHGGNKTMNKR